MQKVAEKSHAILSPSGWDRWSACPGSVVLEEPFPNTASFYAAEGTVAHEIAAICLTDNADPESFVGQEFECDGRRIVADMEMATSVADYISQIELLILDAAFRMVEQEVPIGHLTGETGATGTSDCIGLTNGGTRLVVVDLKYGKGVQVDAEGNGQGRIYALGALEKFALLCEDVTDVEIAIVQPRLDHVTSEVLGIEELREFADEVTQAAGRVEMAGAEKGSGGWAADHLNPGEKQCKFCKAKAVCPALGAEVSSSMALVSSADPEDFPDLTLSKQAASVTISDETDVERLASFMRAAPLIEEAIKAVRAEVERRLLAGGEVPGFKIVQGKKGNRQWADPETIEDELKKRLGAKGTYVKKVISVTEAEKAFKSRPRVWAKIAPLITQAEGKPSVAPESDPRPPMQLGADPDDFPDLTAAPVEAQAALSLMDD